MKETKMTSLKLNEVMEDIGVTDEVIHFRRYVHLLLETIISILQKPLQTKSQIFGSQIEGSTTIGMESDTDILSCSDTMIAFIDPYCGDVLKGCYVIFVIKSVMLLPQCCSLQLVKLDGRGKIVPITVENMDDCIKARIGNQYVLDQQSRVLFSNHTALKSFFSDCVQLPYEVEQEQHGPAITLDGGTDVVFAIYCSSMPDDCRVLFTTQNKPDHWPKLETKIKAKMCGMYLVVPGNLSHIFTYDPVRSAVVMHVRYTRDYSKRQWKMSTNIFERLLMFDLNIVQMKTYIITKMIRKELLKPIVGDRLSTFHMKTALFFTVETLPVDIWTKDNLVQCVLYCFITLRRFLKRRVCPHYTVSGVNLFYDKLQLYEYPMIIDVLSVIIKSQLKCIETLRMDNIGERLLVSVSASSSISTSRLLHRKQNVALIITNLVIRFLDYPIHHIYAFIYTNQMVETHLHLCAANIESWLEHGSEYFEELDFVIKYFYNTSASVKASKCISMKRPINEDIVKMYELSLGPTHFLNYLKYASMLVCTHQYSRAEALLQHVEGMISSDMIHISLDRSDIICTPAEAMYTAGVSSPKEMFLRLLSKIRIDVVFKKEETSCVPSHLVFEMYRTGKKEEYKVTELDKKYINWLNHVVVDAKAFTHYLQYLSSNDVDTKQIAFTKLMDYLLTKQDGFCIQEHIETTLHMIGHIWELEKDIPKAWNTYRLSVKLVPSNNAAYWHLFRLLGYCMYGK